MTPPFGWIEMSNQAQLEWITAYLARQSLSGSLPDSLMQDLKQYGFQQTVNKLNGVPNNAEFRELSRKMKGAWKTRQNRKKHGNPVSLQMPESTMKQLKALAKKRKQSQVQTLSQIINNAMDGQQHITAQVQGERESFREKLNTQQQKSQKLEQAYNEIVDSLLNALAENIDHRCGLETVLEELEHTSLEINDKQKYLNLTKKRVSELESISTKMRAQKIWSTPSLNERLQKKIKMRDFVVDIDDEWSSVIIAD